MGKLSIPVEQEVHLEEDLARSADKPLAIATPKAEEGFATESAIETFLSKSSEQVYQDPLETPREERYYPKSIGSHLRPGREGELIRDLYTWVRRRQDGEVGLPDFRIAVDKIFEEHNLYGLGVAKRNREGLSNFIHEKFIPHIYKNGGSYEQIRALAGVREVVNRALEMQNRLHDPRNTSINEDKRILAPIKDSNALAVLMSRSEGTFDVPTRFRDQFFSGVDNLADVVKGRGDYRKEGTPFKLARLFQEFRDNGFSADTFTIAETNFINSSYVREGVTLLLSQRDRFFSLQQKEQLRDFVAVFNRNREKRCKFACSLIGDLQKLEGRILHPNTPKKAYDSLIARRIDTEKKLIASLNELSPFERKQLLEDCENFYESSRNNMKPYLALQGRQMVERLRTANLDAQEITFTPNPKRQLIPVSLRGYFYIQRNIHVGKKDLPYNQEEFNERVKRLVSDEKREEMRKILDDLLAEHPKKAKAGEAIFDKLKNALA